jgi:hypothetical protein
MILPGTPASVPDARRFVRGALDDRPRAGDLAQTVAELAASAIRWSAAGPDGTFTGLRLSVKDLGDSS